EAKHARLVIAAAHCLPELPPPHSMSYTEERTYPNLLGPLGETEPMVWAECLFGDPVADISILSTPDRQELYDQAAAYDELTELRPSFRIDPLRCCGPMAKRLLRRSAPESRDRRN